jgi:mono/diheme cytochrome c family protein
MTRRRGRLLSVVTLGALVLATPGAHAQHAGHGAAAPGAEAPPRAPRAYTMEELHAAGGVPRGWKFALPAGDPAKGQEVFRALECGTCHALEGESAQPPAGNATHAGPELTGMGSHHPAEYFAESILAPNAVILAGPGFTGPDGRSIMPSYGDSLSVAQLIDLVAFLTSLTGDEGHVHGGAAMEQTTGDYRIRLVYAGGGHGGHGAPGGAAGSHLQVFVADRQSGEPVPYLPVSATLRGGGMKPRVLKLLPMVDARGFHYGVDVRIPDETDKIVVSVGRTTMRVMPPAAGRFTKPVSVEFEWEGP